MGLSTRVKVIYKFDSKDREPAFLKDTIADEYGNEFCLPCCLNKLKKPNENKGIVHAILLLK